MNWKDHTNDLITQSAILQMLLRGKVPSMRLYELSILIYAKKLLRTQSSLIPRWVRKVSFKFIS